MAHGWAYRVVMATVMASPRVDRAIERLNRPLPLPKRAPEGRGGWFVGGGVGFWLVAGVFVLTWKTTKALCLLTWVGVVILWRLALLGGVVVAVGIGRLRGSSSSP